MNQHIIDWVGTAAAVALPFFNIPLILRMIRRKSSEDISVVWVLGVWVCLLLMFPSGILSSDFVFRVFNIVNIVFFTAVAAVTVFYRKKRNAG